MSEEQQEKQTIESVIESWNKAAQGFSKMATSFAPEFISPPMSPFSGTNPGESFSHPDSSSSQMPWESLFSSMGDPKILQAMTFGITALPQMASQLSKNSWDTLFELQKQFLTKAQNMGKVASEKKDVFSVLSDMYEQEFSKIFKIPQLGLTRFYQERINLMLDKYIVFQAAYIEFIKISSIPLEKSSKAVQKKMDQIMNNDKIQDKQQALYKMWIKILEGKYNQLYTSEKYLEAMAKTSKAMTEYSIAREQVLQDLLQLLPIPSNKEMDDVYKDFYLLKKKVRSIEKELNQMRNK
jgi:hypothetical protein